MAPGLDVKAVGGEIRERIPRSSTTSSRPRTIEPGQRAFDGHPFAVVPKVHTALSGRRVLVSDYLEGARFDAVKEMDEATRDRYGEIVFRFFYGLLERERIAAGDPWATTCFPDGRVCFLDFGLVRHVGRRLPRRRAGARARRRSTATPRASTTGSRRSATCPSRTGSIPSACSSSSRSRASGTSRRASAGSSPCPLCGCQGVRRGGWAHYVGQEKVRPITGFGVAAFATDWTRPPRQQATTSFWYLATDQWRRYERFGVVRATSPLGTGA